MTCGISGCFLFALIHFLASEISFLVSLFARSSIIWATWPSGVSTPGGTIGTHDPLRSSQPGGAASNAWELPSTAQNIATARNKKCFLIMDAEYSVGFE